MSDHIYKHLHLTGSSTVSSDDAVRAAIDRAGKTVRDMRWFKIVETRGHIENGKVAHWQVTVEVGFALNE